MANYDLDRVSILVVDDNSYMRSLLLNSLKALGVGQVKVANHGGEAIELLQLMAIDPMKAGLMTLDVIYSNWQMSPVDGTMLLRWVRRHKESPDRFIPFVMVSGYADRARVAEARDLGVTEFLAKPFSVEAVAQRLLQVIERPRDYIHTSTYFGPDRRRQQMTVHGDDRRKLKEGDPGVEVVYE